MQTCSDATKTFIAFASRTTLLMLLCSSASHPAPAFAQDQALSAETQTFSDDGTSVPLIAVDSAPFPNAGSIRADAILTVVPDYTNTNIEPSQTPQSTPDAPFSFTSAPPLNDDESQATQPDPTPAAPQSPDVADEINPTAARQAADALQDSLQTFIVERPANSRLSFGARQIIDRSPDGFGPAPVVRDKMTGMITYSAFPGLEPLDIAMGGTIGGSELQSHLEPLHLFSGDSLDRNSLIMSHSGAGLDLGGNAGDMPDAETGMRLFGPVDHKDGEAGIGLYQRLDATSFSLVPGFDTSLQSSKTDSLDMALTADASMRLTQTNQIRDWSTRAFAGWDAHQREALDSLFVGRRVAGMSLYQSVSLSTGRSRGYSWDEGFARKFGPSNVTIETSDAALSGDAQRRLAVGLFRPLGRNLLSMRWENDSVRQGGASLSSAELVTTLVMPMRNNSILVLGDNLLSADGGGNQHQSLLTDSWQIDRICSLQIGITRNWVTGRERFNAAIGLWATPQWRANFLLGPSTASELNHTQSSTVGFQLVNLFNMTSYATGTVRGTVLLDGLPPTQAITVQVEDRCTKTDTNGHFCFEHVLEGPHEVGFDISQLPATIDFDSANQNVLVQQGKTVNVLLKAHRVGKVTGTVVVDPDALGRVDPTAGVEVVITDAEGDETTTDTSQKFVLGDIPIGMHQIGILASSLPPGYHIVAPETQTVDIESGHESPYLSFHIAPAQQQIEMDTLR